MTEKRKRNLKINAVWLLFFLFAAGLPSPVGKGADFNDMKGHWAAESTCQVRALDLMNGYPDGAFKPEQPVSQLEALVMFMRAAGFSLDKKTSSSSKNKPAAVAGVPPVSWGQNYLNQAAQDQLLNRTELAAFQPDNPATREQVAVLLYRLLQLPPGADTQPAFSDLSPVNEDNRLAILAVAQAGIIKGYEDGSFRPRAGLKRGEAAALLARMVADNWTSIAPERRITGWISKIDLESKKPAIEITSLQGVQSFKPAPDMKCYKNGVEIAAGQAHYYQAQLILDAKKQVAYMAIQDKNVTAASDQQVTGTVKSVAVGKDAYIILYNLEAQERKLPLSWNAVLTSASNTQNKGFQSLKAGTWVKAESKDGEVEKVTILNTKNLSGTVEALSSSRLDLQDKSSNSSSSRTSTKQTPTWFNYWDRARIVDKDGIKDRVLRGDKVKITYLDPDPNGIDEEIPLEIAVTSRPALKKVAGKVESIIAAIGGGGQISLGKNKTYDVDKSASVYRQVYKETPVSINFSDIVTGDNVQMEVDGADIAMKVTVIIK